MVPHADVLAAIDNALRPDRLGIDDPDFRRLMREIAIIESGYKVGGSIQHKNDLSKAAKGVFQITNIALDLSTDKKRAKFWKDWYNTPEDQLATVEDYLNKVHEFID